MRTPCRLFEPQRGSLVRLLTIIGAIAGIGCRADPTGSATRAVPRANISLPSVAQALVVTIDVSRATVHVFAAPTSAIAQTGSPVVAGRLRATTGETAPSLLGGDAMSVDITGVKRSVVGQYQPGKVRLLLEVRLRNGLRTVRMIPPTFPAVATHGKILLIPFVVMSVATPGAATIGPAGNIVEVVTPGDGVVTSSADWDGPLWDFFPSTDRGCVPATATCARFEPFSAPLEPLQATEWRVVGFDLDPRVRYVRVLLLLAADLESAA